MSGNSFDGPVKIIVAGVSFAAQARLVAWQYAGKIHWGGFVTTDTRIRAVAVVEDAHPMIELDKGTFPFSATLRSARSGGAFALTGLGPSPLEVP